MARYVVITPFADIYDSMHDYYEGDVFPHDGRYIAPERISELSSNNNALGKPIIKIAEEVQEEKPKKENKSAYTKTDINRASISRLKEIASEIGIDDADDKTGGELKKLIIEQLGL